MKSNDDILELIKRQFTILIRNNELYKNIKLNISNEQQFIKEKNKDKNAIYIVVKFLNGSLNFGQQTIPTQINVVAEQNKIVLCQELLIAYATTYNLTLDSTETIKQVYSTPSVAENFNDVFNGYRSLFYFTGTFLISDNALNCKIKYKGTPIDVISNAITFATNLDTQAFYTTQDFTKSVALTGTFTLTLASYFVNTELNNDILAMITKNKGINNSFFFDITFKNGITLFNLEMKLVDFSTQENIGEIPVVTATFTI